VSFGCASNLARFARCFLTRVLFGPRSRFRTFARAPLHFDQGFELLRLVFPFSRFRLEFPKRLHCVLQRTHGRCTPLPPGLHPGFGVEAHTAFAVTLEYELTNGLVCFRECFVYRAKRLRFFGSGSLFGVQPRDQCELAPIHSAGDRTFLTRALSSCCHRARIFWASRGQRNYIILAYARGRAWF
jgi:hypothetical protein